MRSIYIPLEPFQMVEERKNLILTLFKENYSKMARNGFYDEDFYYGSGVLMSGEKLGTIKISPGGVGE